MRRWLALELAGTIRHDGNGGVADDLVTPAGLVAWVGAQEALLSPHHIEPASVEDERALSAVVAIRTSARALLARVVAPAPPSRADAGRLPDTAAALTALNSAAAKVPTALSLDWPVEGEPSLRFTAEVVDPVDRLTSLLAREVMLFLADADSGRLAACTAPRCVRYFLKEHGRQEYCKPSCSNRARAARHYRRHEGSASPGVGG